MRSRTTVAFAVSPAIGAAVASIVAVMMWSPHFGLFFSILIVSYAVAVVVGVPAFLLSRSWMPASIWAYALAGAVVAAVAAVPIAFFFPTSLGFLGILTGATAGVAFRLIALPASNSRWSGP
jgi:hypothetical protein